MSDSAGWFRIGHTSHAVERTGCTVVLFEQSVPAFADVRGGAPGTRETDALGFGRLVGKADAFLLTGGSAFGLAAADGVMRYLAERDRGIPTRAGNVPIVPAAVIYDLAVGEPRYPNADDGYAAAMTATASSSIGRVGAGCGATVAKLGNGITDSGIGIASISAGEITVTAIVVLNAVGDVTDPASGRWLAHSTDPLGTGRDGRTLAIERISRPRIGENTTIGAVLVSGSASRDALARCCISAHAALGRCVVPAHTVFDGDTFFAAATGLDESTPADILALACATELAVERAIVSIF